MWVAQVRLNESVLIGPGIVRMTLAGIIGKTGVYLKWEANGVQFSSQLWLGEFLSLSKTIRVKLLKVKTSRVRLGFEAPLDVQFEMQELPKEKDSDGKNEDSPGGKAESAT